MIKRGRPSWGRKSEERRRDSDWHVARRQPPLSWRTCRLTTLHVSAPGTLPVSGVGGLLTRVWMCVCHVRLGWNRSCSQAHTVTLTWFRQAHLQSPDGVPDNTTFISSLGFFSAFLLLALPLFSPITQQHMRGTTAITGNLRQKNSIYCNYKYHKMKETYMNVSDSCN